MNIVCVNLEVINYIVNSWREPTPMFIVGSIVTLEFSWMFVVWLCPCVLGVDEDGFDLGLDLGAT